MHGRGQRPGCFRQCGTFWPKSETSCSADPAGVLGSVFTSSGFTERGRYFGPLHGTASNTALARTRNRAPHRAKGFCNSAKMEAPCIDAARQARLRCSSGGTQMTMFLVSEGRTDAIVLRTILASAGINQVRTVEGGGKSAAQSRSARHSPSAVAPGSLLSLTQTRPIQIAWTSSESSLRI